MFPITSIDKREQQVKAAGVLSMRVVLANKPELLQVCLGYVFADVPGVEVHLIMKPDEESIVRAASLVQPNLFVVNLDYRSQLPRLCRRILFTCPEARVVALGRNKMTLYWFDREIRHATVECTLASLLKECSSEAVKAAPSSVVDRLEQAETARQDVVRTRRQIKDARSAGHPWLEAN